MSPTDTRTAFALRLHAGYRCQQRGVCCNADWAIAVEEPQRLRLVSALERGTFGAITPATAFAPAGRTQHEAVLARDNGRCLFFEPGARNLCAIHRHLGHDALPSACRHFPRVVVLDPRGTFLSLSHVCPTAGALLLHEIDAPFELVTTGPLFTPGAEWEGLDARDALPPQLSAEVLWDWDAWWEWERRGLDALHRHTPDVALAALTRATSLVERWRPGRRSLAEQVNAIWDSLEPEATSVSLVDMAALDSAVRSSVPAALAAQAAPPGWQHAWEIYVAPRRDLVRRPVARYLASRLLANWTGFYARRVSVWTRSLAAAHAVLAIECARRAMTMRRPTEPADVVVAAAAADHLLVHMSSAPALAAALDELPGPITG